MDARSPAPPIFVVGCGRSGTTLVRLMLDAHPDLAVPGESHFVPRLARAYGVGVVDPLAVAADLMATPHFGHWKVPREAVLRRVEALGGRSTLARAIEAAYLANADVHGKLRWGDKTPIHVRSIPLLASLWPDARFVHVIRDGRDVALSYLSLPWGPSTIWAAARKWTRDVSAGIRDGQPLGTSRYLEVRYEDLVADPRSAMERICAVAALPFNASMLDPSRRADHPTLAPDEGRRYHERSTLGVQAEARSWRTEMGADDVRRFEAVAGELLEDLGYERRFSRVRTLDRIEGTLRARALDLLAIGSGAKRVLARRSAG